MDSLLSQIVVVGIKEGRLGFGFSCTSWVHDVTYSLVDQSITYRLQNLDRSCCRVVRGYSTHETWKMITLLLHLFVSVCARHFGLYINCARRFLETRHDDTSTSA